MMKKFSLILLIIILLVVVGGVFAMFSTNFSLDWFVPLTAGESGVASSSNYVMHTTIGQTVIGQSASSSYRIGLGYWSRWSAFLQGYEVYLPMILK